MIRMIAVLLTPVLLIGCTPKSNPDPRDPLRSGTAGASIGVVIGLISPTRQFNENDKGT